MENKNTDRLRLDAIASVLKLPDDLLQMVLSYIQFLEEKYTKSAEDTARVENNISNPMDPAQCAEQTPSMNEEINELKEAASGESSNVYGPPSSFGPPLYGPPNDVIYNVERNPSLEIADRRMGAPATDSFKLAYIEGGVRKTLPLNADQPMISIGRDPTCTLRTSNNTVSRVHAVVTWKDGRIFVMDPPDRHPVNGTKVDGIRLQPGAMLELLPGSKLVCGSFPIYIEQEFCFSGPPPMMTPVTYGPPPTPDHPWIPADVVFMEKQRAGEYTEKPSPNPDPATGLYNPPLPEGVAYAPPQPPLHPVPCVYGPPPAMGMPPLCPPPAGMDAPQTNANDDDADKTND